MSVTVLSDEELVLRYQRGDESCFEVLTKRYNTTIKMLARTLYIVGGDQDDLNQIGIIGLYNATKSYEPQKTNGATFKTYASTCIRQLMLSEIKKACRNEQSYTSIDGITEDGEPTRDFEEEVVNESEVEERVSELKNVMSAFEIKVFDLFLQGYDYREIATKLNKESKAVDNALQRIKEKAKRLRR